MKALLAAAWLSIAPAPAEEFQAAVGRPAPRFERVKEGFYSPRAAPPSVSAAASAAVRLETNFWRMFLLERRRGCTGSYISDDGYLLTAAHCVIEDLTRLRESRLGGRRLWEHAADAVRYVDETTRMRVDGRKAAIAAAGRGLGLANDLEELAGDPAGMARLRAAMLGDWAIVKVDADGPTPCAAASDDVPAAGDKIWLFGYSGEAPRLRAPGAPGGKLVMTEGTVLRDVSKAAWFPDYPLSAASYSAFYQPALDAGHLLISDADAHKGMSGGPAYDRTGRIVGVLSTGWVTSRLEFVPDASKAVSIKRIKDALRSAGLDSSRYFRCPASGRPAPRV